MKRLAQVIAWFALIGGAALVGAPPAMAANLCVGGPGCYRTLQAAVDAAHDGDTITIAPGTFAGGVTIDVSVRLVGAGAGQAVISGGGPVLTIGSFGASTEPTVSISGVTITGGVTHTSWAAVFAGNNVIALGGGIEVPPAENFANGATVTIANSVITDNRAAPTASAPFGPPCPSGPCPFALAGGGGIDNWGAMTLTNTTVSDNQVGGPVASDADAGGIYGEQGSLALNGSTVTGNQASASAPNGRSADSGAIFAEFGTLAMSGSSVTNNSATLNAALPSSVDLLAIAGGIHISDQAAGSIRNTTISGNSATMTNTVGDANAFSGGVHTDVNFELSNDVITNNSVNVATLGRSRGNAAGDSGAGEMGGTVTNTRFAGNSVTVSSVAGDANAGAGATIFAGSMTNSVVSDNHVQASSPHGFVIVAAGGLQVGDALTLRNTTVSGNTAHASGRSGYARGGGIFDVNESPNGPSGGPLTLINSSVTGNALSGSSAITLQGGGIYATNPVSLTNSVIADNIPDQCFGC